MVVQGKHLLIANRGLDFQCSLCRAVWWFAHLHYGARHHVRTFSALSVEPYGGSREVSWTVSTGTSFSALSVEPYGGSWHHPSGPQSRLEVSAFSALSVEPYGGSAGSGRAGAILAHFQCSLCRAVWWFSCIGLGGAPNRDFQCSLCRAVWWFCVGVGYGLVESDFQCSLCRAVWWFAQKTRRFLDGSRLSVLSL